MKAVSKIMTGAVGFAALVGMAAPAAAQYYPGYNTGGGIVGQVLNTIINPYGQQYGQVNSQAAVNRCATAVQARLAQRYSSGYGYSPYGYGAGQYGYNGYAQSNARVLQVTRVEPRWGTTRVRGLATSGMAASYNPYGGYSPYGGYGGYGAYGGYNAGAAADLSFKCDIDSRGYIRDIDVNRRY